MVSPRASRRLIARPHPNRDVRLPIIKAPVRKSPRLVAKAPIKTERASKRASPRGPLRKLTVPEINRNTKFYLKSIYDEVQLKDGTTWFEIGYYPTGTTEDKYFKMRANPEYAEWKELVKWPKYLDDDKTKRDTRVLIFWERCWQEEAQLRIDHPESGEMIDQFRAKREALEKRMGWGVYVPGMNPGISRKKLVIEE